MKRRPAKFIPDYLVPMPSHLLTLTLNDLLHPPQAATSASSPSPSPSPSTSTLPSPTISESSPAPLPQGHHLVYFPIQTPPSLLAPDGADLDHSPGPPFHKRLWAGGEVSFRSGWESRLRLDGTPWGCREEIRDVTVRGKEGDERILVDVWRSYGRGHEKDRDEEGGWDIEERRTLVFMRNGEGKESPSTPRLLKYPHQPTISHSLTPTRTHLFHFSALTFNAHAIHYDPLFARSVDAHRAPLVHGPLTLTLMLRVLNDAVNSRNSDFSSTSSFSSPGSPSPTAATAVRKIEYRNYAPLYVDEKLTVCARRLPPEKEMGSGGGEEEERWDVWVEGPQGGMAVKGSAVLDLRGMMR